MERLTSRIIGTGSALPERILTNSDIENLVDTSDTWIRERTGITERRIAGKQESTSKLAITAGQRALSDAKIKAEDLDFIILATFTPSSFMPNDACLVQAALGASHAICFDINAACSGFLFALQTAHAYICAGMARHILVIGSENTSKIIDWSDRGTCILFGDGAGAVILSASDSFEHGILDFESGSDGSRGNVLTLSGYRESSLCLSYDKNSPCPPDKSEEISSKSEFLKMDGQEVFKFAVRKVPEMILSLTKRNHLLPEEIDWYLLHQANARIINAVAKRLSLPLSRFPNNLSSYGNTSAASIPILLDECKKSNTFLPGQKLVLSGFGGGLTWGSCLLSW